MKKALCLDEGYSKNSIASAGKIECRYYHNNSLLGGKLVLDSNGSIDLRKSNRFHPGPIYDYINRAVETKSSSN
ncbi:MAG: hypothetical protein JW818_13250 [Pirellulales bacterium]|nr:hypothetical protein [Pirellulales bacterium]